MVASFLSSVLYLKLYCIPNNENISRVTEQRINSRMDPKNDTVKDKLFIV